MRSKKGGLITPKLLVLFVLINLYIACAGSNPLSPGAWVEEADRITLMDGGPHKGTWQTRDLTIHYEFQKAAPSLQITGLVELASYIPMGFNTLEFLNVNIHFLDANGIVLDAKRIKSFGSFRSFRVLGDINLDGRFDLAPDTVAFAFSYSGRASTGGGGPGMRGSGSEGGTDWEFWRVPRRSPPQ